MKYIQLYLVFVGILYFVGPIEWKSNNNILLFGLIGAYQLALYLGYKFTFKPNEKNRIEHIQADQWFINNLKYICVFTIIISILLYIRNSNNIPFRQLITNIVNFDMSSLYQVTSKAKLIASSDKFGGKILAYISTLSGPLFVALIPLVMLYWKRVNKISKALSLSAIFVYVMTNLLTGTNEVVFNIFMYATVVLLIKMQVSPQKNKTIKKKRVKLLPIILIIFVFMIFFTKNMTARTYGSYNLPISINTLDMDKWYIHFLPTRFQALLVYLSIYLCQGYYGMSLALRLPWVPTYFSGSSSFLRSNIEEIFRINISRYTYQSRAEVFGWYSGLNWHSAYTWLANDFHWFGVVFIMLLLGAFIGSIYKDSLETKNPIAIILLCIIFPGILFLTANNIVFAQPTTFMAFWFYLIIWLYQRHKQKHNQRYNV